MYLVGLTVKDVDAHAAEGAMARLYYELRKLAGTERVFRYFWWAEFQRRGAIHFHAIWVDAPFRSANDAKRWLRRHWSLSALWPDVKARETDWFTRQAAEYVGAYAKKMGDKAYQQQYDLMPKGWHVFASSQLEWPVAEHKQHEDRPEVEFIGPPELPRGQREGWFWLTAIHVHDPAEGGCRLPWAHRREHSRKRRNPPGEGSTPVPFHQLPSTSSQIPPIGALAQLPFPPGGGWGEKPPAWRLEEVARSRVPRTEYHRETRRTVTAVHASFTNGGHN